MKTLDVYFSRSGHTEQIAREFAERLNADLEEVREKLSAAADIRPPNLSGSTQSEAVAQPSQMAGSNAAKAAGHPWAV